MKRIGLMLSVAATLCLGTTNVQGYWGCGRGGGFWIGGGCWPLLGFGIGFGCGRAYGYPAYGYSYSYPAYTYSYAPPAYSYSPPATSAPEATPAPVVAQHAPWVPSTPGTGSWVPDSTPYCYTPRSANSQTVAAKPAAASKSTVVTFAGTVPVYHAGR